MSMCANWNEYGNLDSGICQCLLFVSFLKLLLICLIDLSSINMIYTIINTCMSMVNIFTRVVEPVGDHASHDGPGKHNSLLLELLGLNRRWRIYVSL